MVVIAVISRPLSIQGTVGDTDFNTEIVGTLGGDNLSEVDQGFKGHHGHWSVGTHSSGVPQREIHPTRPLSGTLKNSVEIGRGA